MLNDLDAYRFHMRTLGLSENTMRHYCTSGRQWLAWCELQEVDPGTATRAHMMAFLNEDGAGKMSGTNRLRALGLRAYCDYLIAQGVRDDNPAKGIKPIKQNSRPTEPLRAEELGALLNACETPTDRAMLLLLLGGGLRRSEVLNIRQDDVDLDHGTIQINGKGAKYRLIAPGRTAMDAVRTLVSCACHRPTNTAPNPRLFTNGHPDSLRRRLNQLAAKAGISSRIHPHRFRHTFAVSFCDLGGGIDQLQMILGHSSLQMSMYYSRSGRQQRAIAAQALHNPADVIASRQQD